MKSIICLMNNKNGSGKTTIALNIASILANENKMKTGVLEFGTGYHDTAVYLNTEKSHLINGNGISDCFLNSYGIHLFRTDEGNSRNVLKDIIDELDVLLIDADTVLNENVLNLCDRILIVTELAPVQIRYAKSSIEHLLKHKYPSSMINIVINKNQNTILSSEDIKDIFREVGEILILPYEEEIKSLSEKGELRSVNNKRSSFARILKSVAEGIAKFTSDRDYRAILGKWNNKEGARDIENSNIITLPNDIKVKPEDSYIELKKNIHKKLFKELDVRNREKDALSHPEKKVQIYSEIESKIRSIMDMQEKRISDKEEREKVVSEIMDEVVGFGAIENLLKDASITEIMVNKCNEIYVERKGKLTLSDRQFTDDASALRAIERIVMPLGRRIDESMPYVDARLPDGSRVNAIIPPLALDGPVITIRKFSDKKLTVQDLIEFGSITKEAAEYLETAVKDRKNIVISGGTGSGKTTLLNISSSFIPSDERIVTIEDSAELKLPQDHVVRLESRPPNIEGKGEVTIRDLVKNALRMRPDRIVVGECRGGETLDMLQAMNTGHEGSMTTVHANSPRDAISRMEVLVLMSGVELPVKAIREQIRGAVDIIVQQSRMKDGSRKITYISEITGMEGDTILMHNVFEFVGEGEDNDGRILGQIKRADHIEV